MSRDIIKEMNRTSLVAVYLLPLLGMNMVTFGLNNYRDCLVTTDGEFILVKVGDLTYGEEPYHNRNYATSLTYNGEHYMVFFLSPKWRHTFEKFCQGKYSEFTERAKQTIIQNTDLMWQQETNRKGVITTDARLMAMYKNPELKALLEAQLDEELGDGELMNPPRSEVFLDATFSLVIRQYAGPSI